MSRNCRSKVTECKNCGRKGHRKEDCWEKNMKCWKWQKLGHRESRCKKNKSNLDREKREEEGETNILLEETNGKENEEDSEAIIDTECRASICGEF